MKKSLLKQFYLLFLICTFPLTAHSIQECNLKPIETKVGRLSIKEMSTFFNSFNRKCLQSSEFSEWSNELLFSSLEKQPQIFIEVLEKQDEALTKIILSTLESPVNDGIDIKTIHALVKATKINSRIKPRIIQALRVAGDNLGMELK